MDRNYSFDDQRQRLAVRLRELRDRAGLSGERLAAELGWSQSKVSKIENGRTRPSAADVSSWAAATGASESVRAELIGLAEVVLAEARSWKASHRGGLARRQMEVAELEAGSSLIRSFQPDVIPGLLQTADYARHVLTLADVSGRRDVAAAVMARVERQAILYQEGKTFRFVLTEAALRWAPGTARLLAVQLDRLQSLSTLPAVDLGVLPLDSQAPALYANGFLLFETEEEPLVMVETYTRELLLTDADDVSFYRSLHDRLHDSALHGSEARMFIDEIKNKLMSD